VVQEYLPNTCDYRVLIMGNREPLQIKRTAVGGSHLNNTSQGGTAELSDDLPTEILENAKKLAKVFQLDIGGIDVLQNQANGQYYFLEVNNQPQLVSGALPNQKMEVFQVFLDDYFSSTGLGS
jgi:glutathione synthase/RimK-type ligase-like ATP-grasp enzyme